MLNRGGIWIWGPCCGAGPSTDCSLSKRLFSSKEGSEGTEGIEGSVGIGVKEEGIEGKDPRGESAGATLEGPASCPSGGWFTPASAPVGETRISKKDADSLLRNAFKPKGEGQTPTKAQFYA